MSSIEMAYSNTFISNDGKYALNDGKGALNDDKDALNDDKDALNDDKDALNDDKDALNDGKDALNTTEISKDTVLQDTDESKYNLLKNALTKENVSKLKVISNENNNDNKKIRVGLFPIKPFLYNEAENDNTKYTTGLIYDIWDKVKKQLLEENLVEEIDEILLKKDEFSGDEAIKLVEDGKLDLLIGGITITHTREDVVNFTRPVFLNKISYSYISETNKVKDFLTIFYKYFIPPIFILLIISTIMGFFVQRFSPRRNTTVSIWLTITSLLGEAGYIAEGIVDKYKTSGWKAYITVFIVMLIAFYFGLYLQATVTNALQFMEETEIIHTPEQLKGKSILAWKEYGNEGAYWNRLGMNVDLVEQSTDIAKEYNDNKDKYIGYTLDYEEMLAINESKPDLNLTTSKYNYGLEEIAWAVNMKKSILIQEINNILVELQSENVISKICKSYIAPEDLYLCAI